MVNWFFYFARPKTNNRRQHSRAKAHNLIKENGDVTASNPQIFNLVDISESGLQLSTAAYVRPGQILNLVINLGREGKQIIVQGSVVWSRKTKETRSLYRVGVYFVEIRDMDRDVIRDYVKKQKVNPRRTFPILGV